MKRTAQDVEDFEDLLKREMDTVARKLENLADSLRRRMSWVSAQNDATREAADFVSEFTNGVGSIGSFLWTVVHNAGILDTVRREFEEQNNE